ncbi:hypothetical protein QQS21_001856 [Conoideocrella luteorostrata]|uniref:DUF1917-domain-containing protein n=1 Tax=Conoideocrella luteorostrata TaxID=1105319 RepID=A0AAJ0CW77_9HYPO|nr:hypothetical protein QQS21_001856 [Conoideocrella luteorostrata]
MQAEGGGFMRGNEDEGPVQTGSQLHVVVQGGMERLELLAELEQKVKNSQKSSDLIRRELFQERRNASADILDLAHAGRVQTGKWMIFCSPTAVNEVWELVAGATANNELGIAAKVAPRPEFDELRKDRIICIYTADFKDKADVSRVLQRIRELRLADYYQRPIYYKPDVYTYLGIASGNPWGLRASIYSSKEFSKQLKA